MKSPSRKVGLATIRTTRSLLENRVEKGWDAQSTRFMSRRSTSSGVRRWRGASSSSRRTPPDCTATDSTPAPVSSCVAMVLETLVRPSTAREASSAARMRSM